MMDLNDRETIVFQNSPDAAPAEYVPPVEYCDAEVQAQVTMSSPYKNSSQPSLVLEETYSRQQEQALGKSESRKSIQSKHSVKSSPMKEHLKKYEPKLSNSEAALYI